MSFSPVINTYYLYEEYDDTKGRWHPDKISKEKALIDAYLTQWLGYEKTYERYSPTIDEAEDARKSGYLPPHMSFLGLIGKIQPKDTGVGGAKYKWKAFLGDGRITPEDAASNRKLKLQRIKKINEEKHGYELTSKSKSGVEESGDISENNSISFSTEFTEYWEERNGEHKTYGKSNDGYFQSAPFAKSAVEDKLFLKIQQINLNKYRDYKHQEVSINKLDSFLSEVPVIHNVTYQGNVAQVIYLDDNISLDIEYYD